jgi:hypothetical protein
MSRREKIDVGEGGSHGLEARATRGRGPLPPPSNSLPQPLSSSGAQASSRCSTGKMPVFPVQGSREGSLRGGNPRRDAWGHRIGDPSALPSTLLSLAPGKAALLWGEPFRSLAAAAAAWGVARGARVLVVDAANAFDPYRLVREARGRGISRAAALCRVRVARAFTSHQLVRLLKEELPGELEPLSLVLVLGPVSLFYDEQIPLAERRRLFTNMVELLAAYKARAPLLLLQPPRPRGAANRNFGRMLTPLLDYLVELGNQRDNRIGTSGGRWSTGAAPSLPRF